MLKVASTFARTGVIALGVLTALGGMAMTAPLGPVDRPELPASSYLPVAWRGGHGGHWHGGHGHYGHHNHGGFGIALGLPLFGFGGYGVYPGYGGYYGGYGAGYYGGYGAGYYGGYYPRRYYRSYYPRRYYGAGNGHVRSCYARYRSYRAWDNTYQPYNGPRRQCL